MKMKYKKERTEPDRWKPLADIFSGLMLMFLLILMLIVLFIGYKDEFSDADVYDTENSGYTESVQKDDGDKSGTEKTELIGDNEIAAVRVVVVDGTTGDVIEQAGIDFNLLSEQQSSPLTLHTYYPEKIAYKDFTTKDDGAFLLPEKLEKKTYVLKNISAPEGYISGETMAFTIDDTYYWDNPYEIRFPLSAKKRGFAIRVTDTETGEPVPMGVYDISTTDGKTVGKIVCDESGYGQAEALTYNDEYVITQGQPNEFYAAMEHPVTVTLNENDDKVVDIGATKTTFELCMTDELYKTPIEGVTVSVYRDDGVFVGEYTTNDKGTVRLQNLSKNTTYTVEQTSWEDKWQKNAYKTEFNVDTIGKINDSPIYSVTGTNRMIRAQFAVKDKLLGFNISDEALSLKDANGQIIEKWSSESDGTIIEGLIPGSYVLEAEGGEPIEISIEDTSEIQNFSYSIFKPWLFIAIFIGCIGILSVLVLFITFGIKRKKSLRKESENDESEK